MAADTAECQPSLKDIFNLAPKNAKQGVTAGLTTLAECMLMAPASIIGAPVFYAQREGMPGVAKGLALGVVGVAAFPILGICVASYQVGKGIAAQTDTLMHERRGERWDELTQKWVRNPLHDDAKASKQESNVARMLRKALKRKCSSASSSGGAAGRFNVSDELDMDDGVPSMFICPITQDVMEDPCVASDGFTYERIAIEEWLRGHATSPMTNLRLKHKTLFPNKMLYSAIQDWRRGGGARGSGGAGGRDCDRARGASCDCRSDVALLRDQKI